MDSEIQMSVTNYRIYLLDPSGKILKGVDAECFDDAAAYSAARDVFKENGEAEVWSGTRLVGRVQSSTD